MSHTRPRPRSGNEPPIATSAIPNAGNTPPASNPCGSAAATNASTAAGSTGSAPDSASVSDDRSRSFARRSALVASTQAKFGPAVAVPWNAEIHSIQWPGWAMKSCGAACTSSTPFVIGSARNPTRPMSWYSGSHDTITSSDVIEPAWQHASMLADSTRSGIITPFGSLVEPLVYCRITSRSGSGVGSSRASPDGSQRAPGSTALIDSIGGVALDRLVERGELVIDQQQLGVAVLHTGAGRQHELLERPHPHRQRQHHRRRTGQPAAAHDRDQRPARGPEDRHVVAGDQPARLQCRADDPRLVVDLPPRDVHRQSTLGDGGADEPDAGRPIGGRLQALDRGGGHRIEGSGRPRNRPDTDSGADGRPQGLT